jgi:hypothetical protein
MLAMCYISGSVKIRIMNTKYLLPNKLRPVGLVLLIPSALLGFFIIFFDLEFKLLDYKVFAIYSYGLVPLVGGHDFFCFVKANLTATITGVVFLVGAMLVAFSKEKHEDGFTAKTRLESLVWAAYVNYAMLIFCFIFFYGMGFVIVMICNMFTFLIFYILRFKYILYKKMRSAGKEHAMEMEKQEPMVSKN